MVQGMSPNRGAAVAVIMTFYENDSIPYFRLAIDSIKSQKLDRDIHIYLCIDGALSSEKDQFIDSMVGEFYKVLRNETNIGLAESLNRLIDVLEDEEFVFRMDGDDISLPERFATQIKLLSSDDVLGLVGCQAIDIDEKGETLQSRNYPTEFSGIKSAMARLNPVLHPSFCIRRKILYNKKLRYPEAYLTEDFAFIINIIQNGYKIENAKEYLIKWRVGSGFLKRRRSFRRGVAELYWYSFFIYKTYGLFSYKYIYPVARFILRILPVNVVLLIYNSSIRQVFAK